MVGSARFCGPQRLGDLQRLSQLSQPAGSRVICHSLEHFHSREPCLNDIYSSANAVRSIRSRRRKPVM